MLWHRQKSLMKWQTLQVLFLQRWTTAKGGIAVAIQAELGIPVKNCKFGVGETIDDLQKFDADEFVNALFYREDEEK